jgi:hypothetical protein
VGRRRAPQGRGITSSVAFSIESFGVKWPLVSHAAVRPRTPWCHPLRSFLRTVASAVYLARWTASDSGALFQAADSRLARVSGFDGILRELPESNVVESSLKKITERLWPGKLQIGSGPLLSKTAFSLRTPC